MNVFTAPPLSIEEQIQLLQEKGLNILPEHNLAHWLSHVSYFRLKHYTNKFKDATKSNFIPNTTFSQVISLYLFDRDLKFILFDAIETIEIFFKTLLSNLMAQQYGAHWYMSRSSFLPKFDFDEFSAIIESEVREADEVPIKHYRRTYDTPLLPPCWMIMEIISFGRMSKMFEHLGARDVKLSNSLYATVCCILHLINKIQPSSKFKSNLLQLINSHPEIDYEHMGFSENWRTEALWQ